MGSRVQRLGDQNDKGGFITEIPQSTVFIGGRLVAVNGSKGISHEDFSPDHIYGTWYTVSSNSKNVFINGMQLSVEGDSDSCWDVRIGGAESVFIG